MFRKSFFMSLVVTTCILTCITGCNKTADAPTPETTEVLEENTLPPETTIETRPEPQVTDGFARINDTPAVLCVKMRGDQVDVVGEYDALHYVIKTDLGYGLIRKEFLRMDGSAEYEPWTAYAYWHAEFYDNLYLSGDPVQQLATNTPVNVLDDLGYCYVAKVGDVTGFIRPNRVSKWRFNSGSSDHSGSSDGRSSPSAGKDGGDISLYYEASIQLLSAIEQTGEVTGTGTILADGTEVILGYFAHGEKHSDCHRRRLCRSNGGLSYDLFGWFVCLCR